MAPVTNMRYVHNPRTIISIPTIFKQGVMVNQMKNGKPVLNPSDMSNITGWVFDLFISEGISPPSEILALPLDQDKSSWRTEKTRKCQSHEFLEF